MMSLKNKINNIPSKDNDAFTPGMLYAIIL